MNVPVVLRPEARTEFDEAADWYEGKRAGLGDDFIDCVEDAFDRISKVPGMHPMVYKDIRRGMVKRFPYAVFYRVEADQVVVIAVFHCHRKPSIWKKRASD